MFAGGRAAVLNLGQGGGVRPAELHASHRIQC